MKKLILILAVIASAKSNAFIECRNDNSTFSIFIYESNPLNALIVDSEVSSATPLSYLCNNKKSMNRNNLLSTFTCVGGGMGEENKIEIKVNESKEIANYIDFSNLNRKKINLKCDIKR